MSPQVGLAVHMYTYTYTYIYTLGARRRCKLLRIIRVGPHKGGGGMGECIGEVYWGAHRYSPVVYSGRAAATVL